MRFLVDAAISDDRDLGAAASDLIIKITGGRDEERAGGLRVVRTVLCDGPPVHPFPTPSYLPRPPSTAPPPTARLYRPHPSDQHLDQVPPLTLRPLTRRDGD